MSSSNVPSKDQLLKTLRKLEKRPKDSAAILGEIGITVFGASVVGFAVSAMGVTTAIPVVTAVTGIVLVGATPIGLVATATVAGGAAAYGLAQVLKHGSKAEATKAKLKEDIRKSIKDIEAKERASNIKDKDLGYFYSLLRQALDSGLISRDDAFELLTAISNGSISLSEGYKMINNILKTK
ncbi:hypothetical protein [Crocosphaera chwakensis]|uniref:Uncharacterized protein n=1 Tax=Crocosphaera chwakensis CCY0110 TaxID=391612 RepID=A3IWA2_9CHRO|nr:hypothetical protein [Crocosphaera chwakensis]EAZ89215.1 hypothetical protein CY0110_06679 [Crocosphaera chwakensis CCY0110]